MSWEAARGTVKVGRTVRLSGGSFFKIEADSAYDDAGLDSTLETVAENLDARIRKELSE